MTTADAVGREPWLLRALRLPRWVPFAAGASLVAALMSLRFLLPAPSFPYTPDGDPWVWLFPVMLAVYGVTVPFVLRGGLGALSRVEDLPADRRPSLERELASPRLAALVPWFVAAVPFHLVLAGIDGRADAVDWAALASNLASKAGLWVVLGWVHILVWAWASALLFHTATVFRRLGRELSSVDLLDHGPLAPFVQIALLLMLVPLSWIAAAVFFHVDWYGDRSFAPQVLVIAPIWIAIGTALFLFPLWGVHERLVAARAAELESVDRAIRGDRAALEGTLIAADAGTTTTAELIAYRAQVAAFSVWPFEPSSLARFGLYLGIPLLGWVGGALVERALDAFLD